MEDIAARAGVAVGTVYNYFEDRKTLVSALLESRTKSMLDELDAGAPVAGRAHASAGGDAAALFHAELRHFVEALGRHVEANRFLFSVLQDEEGQRGIDAVSATRKRTMLGELQARAERLMEKGMKSKVLRKADPAEYAAMFIGMMRGVVLKALIHRQAVPAGSADAVVELFLHGASR